MNKLVRSVGIISAAVTFGAGTALAAPLAGAQSSLPGSSAGAQADVDDCGVTTVTPSGLKAAGWSTPSDETPAEIGAVADAPAEVGAAAVTFPVADPAVGTSLYKNANKMPLAELMEGDELVDLSYDYFSSGQAPALQIRVNGADLADSESNAGGYDIGFATIVHSPANSDGEWKTADPGESDSFWVTRALKGEDGQVIPRMTMMTFEQILELNWDAVVTEYGVQKTKENVATNDAVDNFTLGCETTNFELADEDGSAGSLSGIFGSVSGIFQS
ncbi:hypothetical protein [Rhodococcus sp. IEGM 1408]|uniref:hypothetical protein n=1 Tax=Rhodococcus sp. IEGM 1408 TaxID=3082220 RepID=UPI0029557BED|nr:hypothetical protein [Rhodococcus sp. IEGM 1408]MDV8001921.1 hypothetical protein [Rhodococcus sp. IEGM 1408]